MKRKDDPRHRRRKVAVKQLFAYSFNRKANVGPLAKKVVNALTHIDRLISECAPEWPIDKINKTDLAILRLAVSELLRHSAPHKVVIDEAVELAKEYGSSASSSFVNGV